MENIVHKRTKKAGAKISLKGLMKKVVAVTLMFGVALIFARAKIMTIAPFAISLMLAICLKSTRTAELVICAVLLAVACYIVSAFDLVSLVVSGSSVAIIMAVAILTRSISNKKRSVIITIISAVTHLVALRIAGETVVEALLSMQLMVVCGVLLSFAVPVIRGKRELNTYTKAGLGCLSLTLFLGLANVTAFGCSVPLLAIACLAPLARTITSSAGGLYLAITASIGLALGSMDIAYFAVCLLTAVAGVCFAGGARVLSVIGELLAFVSVTLLFSASCTLTIYDIISVAVGGLVYMLIPKKVLSILSFNLTFNSNRAVMQVARCAMIELANKVQNIADGYAEMSGYISNMLITQKVRFESAEQMGRLTSFCTSCTRRESCPLGAQVLDPQSSVKYHTKAEITQLAISVSCERLGGLASPTNGKSSRAGVQDEVLGLYSSRLMSIAHNLGSFVKDAKKSVEYDVIRSQKLLNYLREEGCNAQSCQVYERGGLVIAHRSESVDKISRLIARYEHSAIEIDGHTDCGLYNVITYRAGAVISLVYGYSGKAKHARSGDTFSAERNGDYALVSLCDGKGSGEVARKFSETTLAIVDNFYRTNGDSVQLITHINSLLAVGDSENFSAMDILKIDLLTAQLDIIKAGSPPSYLISGGEVTKIEGSSLPVGVVQEFVPSIARKHLKPLDTIVLVSDGVHDQLPNLGTILATTKCPNAKLLADHIMSLVDEGGGYDDDMSIVVLRAQNTYLSN